MGIHVNDLKAFAGDFARGYLFNIYFTDAPVEITGGESLTRYLVRSSTIPESTIDPIEVPWQGQMYKIASTHVYAEWEITFNLDQGAWLRKRFDEWSELIHNSGTNLHGLPSNYFGTVKAELLSGVTGLPTMTYTINNAWPSNVGAIDLAQDNKDIVQFPVTFTYTWHETE